jgi:NADH:ubiquinone oxidoreductase subunit 4 (subunit M)
VIDDWLTTILILLPVGAALVVWLLPWSNQAAGSVALLAALVEVGVWINTLVRFDFAPGSASDRRSSSSRKRGSAI